MGVPRSVIKMSEEGIGCRGGRLVGGSLEVLSRGLSDACVARAMLPHCGAQATDGNRQMGIAQHGANHTRIRKLSRLPRFRGREFIRTAWPTVPCIQKDGRAPVGP